ncbi:MAG: cytochrome c biogenesis protein CcsA [Pirellulaceae bacterium]|jgi:ABC-type uncharacterized transport system permease subunit|nr:cytochrome c biogenesis protein CcsA [Pirellulaceae bacterium]MDP6557009.1 cytochrome c biogenesis protein CcsA [Pirellulaceae bacterium]
MFSIFDITITCFASSYAVCLALEASRLLFQARIRQLLVIGMAVAGLFAHSIYLVAALRDQLAAGNVAPLSNWHDFCLLAAWVLVGAYLGLALRRPQNNVGLFVLPPVLGLIGLAVLFQTVPSFPRNDALYVWRMIHGLMLLVGTVAVTLGFTTGLMYLVQAYRLKHKLLPRRGLRLPSLEWLQRFNGESLVVSTCSLAIGLVSGVVLNLLQRSAAAGVAWTDPVVISSALLFTWLACMTTFESVYKPARQGRKVAYLTMASFLFLLLALGLVLTGQHASQTSIQKSISKTELESLSLSTARPFSNDPGAGGGS